MNIEFDETDVYAISAALAKLHKMRTALCRNDPSARISNVRYDKRLAAIQKEYEAAKNILRTDISSVYGCGDGPRTFYVYAHCNPRAPLQIKDNARHLIAAEWQLS